MRVRTAIIVLAILPIFASAQVVTEGATPEDVIRALGQPRSRSSTRGREIWLYPQQQAVFEHGRLISVVALPDDGGNIAWQKRAAAPASSPAKQFETTDRVRLGIGGRSSPVSGPESRGLSVKREGAKRSQVSPARAAPVPEKRRGGLMFRVMLTLVWLAHGVVGITVWYRQRKGAMARVAENNLARAAAKSEPAGVSKSAAMDRDAVEYSRADSRPPMLSEWELTPELLCTMEWKRFELLVQRYFIANGLHPKTHLVGADGGFDLHLYRGDATRPFSYVKCRSWGHPRTDALAIRDLFSIMAETRIAGGMFVSTGGFTPEAKIFGRQNKITLVSGADFIARFNRLPSMIRARILTDVTAGDFTTPSCPRCNVKLVPCETDGEAAPGWCCLRSPQCHYTLMRRTDMAVSALQS